MNDEARKLFEELGSTVAKDLAFRDSWVFVGAKGIENKSPFEQVRSAVHHFLISGNLLCVLGCRRIHLECVIIQKSLSISVRMTYCYTCCLFFPFQTYCKHDKTSVLPKKKWNWNQVFFDRKLLNILFSDPLWLVKVCLSEFYRSPNRVFTVPSMRTF